MARHSGSFSLGGTLEPKVDAPLDARLVVQTKADLLAASSYPYKYIGMEVFVQSEMKKYRLIENDTTDEDSWLDLTEVKAVVYKPSGSIYFAALPSLVADNVGNVYDIKDDFTTTADFLEGAGKPCKAGTNVAIVDNGTAQTPDIKYDVMSASIDTSIFMLSVTTPPLSPAGGDYIFYHGTASGDFANGDGIYKYDLANTRWVHQDLGFVEQGIVALPFSTTTVYAVNDRCYKDGFLYKCTTAHTGAWDASDFTTVTLDDVIPKPLTASDLQDIKDSFKGMNKGAPLRMMVYSPNEQAVGKWQQIVDGVLKEKPLYEKTIDVNNITFTSTDGTKYVDLITDASTLKMVDSRGVFKYTLSNIEYTQALNTFIYNDARSSIPLNTNIYYDTNVNKIRLRIGQAVSASLVASVIATIQYTKTTDTWITVS